MTATCGRCQKTVENPEVCWYCGADLCYECWDELGHCGHAAADDINQKAAEGKLRSIPLSTILNSN